MALYHGRRGLAYIGTTGAGTATSVASLTSWTLDAPSDLVDVTAFGDSNKSYVMGIKDCTGSLEGWWDDAVDTLWDASSSAAAVPMYLYPSSLVLTKYWYGKAFLDFSINVGVGDAVKISGKWAANGSWGQM